VLEHYSDTFISEKTVAKLRCARGVFPREITCSLPADKIIVQACDNWPKRLDNNGNYNNNGNANVDGVLESSDNNHRDDL